MANNFIVPDETCFLTTPKASRYSRYWRMDIPINPSPMTLEGKSPLYNLYPKSAHAKRRPMEVGMDYNPYNIPNSDPIRARDTYNRTQADIEEANNQELAYIRGQERPKLIHHPAVEPDVFLEDPTLQYSNIDTGGPDGPEEIIKENVSVTENNIKENFDEPASCSGNHGPHHRSKHKECFQKEEKEKKNETKKEGGCAVMYSVFIVLAIAILIYIFIMIRQDMK